MITLKQSCFPSPHRQVILKLIIAQRIAQDACTDYKPFVKRMIGIALDKLAMRN